MQPGIKFFTIFITYFEVEPELLDEFYSLFRHRVNLGITFSESDYGLEKIRFWSLGLTTIRHVFYYRNLAF